MGSSQRLTVSSICAALMVISGCGAEGLPAPTSRAVTSSTSSTSSTVTTAVAETPPSTAPPDESRPDETASNGSYPVDDHGRRLVEPSAVWPAYACGPIIFPDANPPDAITETTVAVPELLASAGLPGVDQDNFYEIYDWRVVVDTGTWISLLGYPLFEPEPDLYGGSHGYIEFALHEDEWIQVGSSWCDPEATLVETPPGPGSTSLLWPDEYREAVVRWKAGDLSDEVSEAISEFMDSGEARGSMGKAEWRLDPDLSPDPDASLLPVQINEWACAGGQAPVNRDIEVLASDSQDGLVLTVFVEPVRGGAVCPGNPWYPITIQLEAPLGDRQLLDGVSLPPAERP